MWAASMSDANPPPSDDYKVRPARAPCALAMPHIDMSRYSYAFNIHLAVFSGP